MIARRARLLAAATLIASAALASACGHTPKEGESIADVCKKENDGKEVSVSGYLVEPKMMTFCSDSCTLRLSATRQEKDPTLTTSFMVGDGKGQMKELPKKFTAKDIDIQDSAGKHFSPGSAVRLTGKLMVNDSLCSMFKPEKIEAQ